MESPTGLVGTLLGLSSIALLILANAYFVATEFALVAVRKSQVKLWMAQGQPGAEATAHAVEHLDDAIAATQLGITLASIGLGFLGEPALARLIDPLLHAVGVDSVIGAHGVAIALTFCLITFLHVVAGELAPKALALQRPREVALACARPLLIFARTFRWILWLMNGAGNLLVRALGIQPVGHMGVPSAEELLIVVSDAREAGELQPQAARMLGNVLRFTAKRVRELMVPREQVCAIPLDLPGADLVRRVREEGYTRYPVYDGTLDRVVGILHVKDLLERDVSGAGWDLASIVRPQLEMAAGLRVSSALHRFRRERSHLAVVREHADGPVVGIVALEDVLEEIVGEIEDEHDAAAAKAASA